jgi:hypothetical protein
MRDIFESDLLFIRFASSVLIFMGLVLGILGISCKLINWGYCEWQWVPLFGSLQDFPRDLLNINMPLAMLALGFSSRLFSVFGWSVCVLVLGVLASFFSWLAYSLVTFPERFMVSAFPQSSSVPPNPHLESIIVNLGLVFICALGLVYLFLPPVRKLYW